RDSFDFTKDGRIGFATPHLNHQPPTNPFDFWLLLVGSIFVFLGSAKWYWLRKKLLLPPLIMTAVCFSCAPAGNDDSSELPSLNEGGHRYETLPLYIGSWESDNWISMSEEDEPKGREGHTAVWSGSEMLIWGGSGSVDAYL